MINPGIEFLSGSGFDKLRFRTFTGLFHGSQLNRPFSPALRNRGEPIIRGAEKFKAQRVSDVRCQQRLCVYSNVSIIYL